MTSGGNSFNDFPDNQFTKFCIFLPAYLVECYCITIHYCPYIIYIIWGNVVPPKKIFGEIEVRGKIIGTVLSTTVVRTPMSSSYK